MALVVFDRVQETTATTGTGTITLGGAVTGYQSFAVVGNGNTTFYCITNGGQWEVGLGTYSTTGPTLARTTVYSNSNGNTSPITLVGASNVFVTYPAGRSVYEDASGNVSPLGTIASGVWQGTTIGVAYGGTGVTASSGANSVVLRDANQNIAVNRVNQSNTTTTAAGGTTALTVASTYIHTLVGTGGQTYTLPDATTLATGVAFLFNNLATGTLTLQDYATGAIGTIPSGGAGAVFLTNNGTVGGTWDLHAYLPEGVTFGTNAFNLGTAIVSGGTWQGGTIQPAYGGTGLTTFAAANNALYSTGATTLTAGTLPVTAGGTAATTFTANGVLYGNGTSALGVTAAGTTGQVLIATTSGAPSWGAVPTTAAVTSLNFGTTGLTPATATTGAITVAGTLNVANGGTGLTSLTANRIPYGAGTSALGNSSALTFDGANILSVTASAAAAVEGVFTNTSAGGTSSAGVRGVANSTGYYLLRQYGTGVTATTVFGQTLANYALLLSDGASSVGLMAGTNTATPLIFGTNNAERMRILSGGNVGIGLTSPTFKFQVQGSGGFTSSGADVSLQVGYASGAADTGLYYNSSDGALDLRSRTGFPLALKALGSTYTFFSTNGTERMRILSGGNVGISTTTPPNKLAVVSASTTGNSFTSWANHSIVLGPNAGSSTGAALGFGFNTTTSESEIVSVAPNTAWKSLAFFSTTMRFCAVGGVESMRITSTGGVCIGNTTDPGATNLSVTGTGSFTGGIVGSAIGATTPSTGAFTTLSASGVATFSAGTVSAPAITTTGDTNTGIFFPAADTIAFTEGGVESMRINASGQVGIGTISPSIKLDVQGTGTDHLFRVLNTGSVASDDSILLIQTSGTGATNTISGLYFGDGDSQSVGQLQYRHSDNSMQFYTDSTARIHITSAGLVGIGTTTPATTLDVNGSIYTNAIFRATGDGTAASPSIQPGNDADTGLYRPATNEIGFSTAGTERMRIDASGLVGIGKTPSGYQLDIDAGANSGIQTTQTALTCQNIISTDATASGMNIQYFKDSASPTASDSLSLVRTFGRSSTGVQREYSRVTTTLSSATNAAENGQYAIAIIAAGTLSTKLQLNNTSIRAIEAYTLTTASAANMNVDTNGVFARSTSSIKYKTQVEDLAEPNSANIYNMRPVWYRSTCDKDNKNWSYYGLIAEEVAELDPRLVHWGYGQDQYDISYIETDGQKEEVKTLKEDAELQPEGVQYDRLTVLLVQEMKALKAQVEAQALEIQALKTR